METRAAAAPSGLARPRRRTRLERRLNPRWQWWAPFVGWLVVVSAPFLLVRAISALIGIAVVIAVSRRPERALTALVVLVPFHLQLFAGLYRLGAPAEMVKAMAQWKEIAIAGVLVAGFQRARRERHRLDRLDQVALAYVVLGLLYLFVPQFFVGRGAGASLDFSTKLLGWRTDVLYVAFFLACRHLRFTSDAVARFVRTFLLTATVVAAIALFEFAFPSTWNSLMIDHLETWRYKVDVLRVNPLNDPWLYDVRVYTAVGGRDVLRVGSVHLFYQALAFYLLLAAGLLANRVVQGRATGRHYAALATAIGAVLLTQTRSAILGLAVVLAITLFRKGGDHLRAADARARFALVLGAVAALAVPAALAVGVVDRFQGDDDYRSNDLHRGSFEEGTTAFSEHPLGQGLATSAGAGQRADVEGRVVTETQILQIGTQLGVPGTVLWLGTAIGAVVALGRAIARAPAWLDTGPAAAVRATLLGFFVTGLFLQTFIDFSVSWTVWPLAGLALGMLERARIEPDPTAASRLVRPAW